MKWDITVWVEDGTITATMHGQVPDGEYVITGQDGRGGYVAALSSCAPGVQVGITVGQAQREE